jgi:endonuclease/exonuclease/phosphatase (EEP) superfamily protein YafD
LYDSRMKNLLRSINRSMLFYIYLFAFLSCAGSVLAFLHDGHYVFEILDSLRYQFILSLAIGSAAALLCKRRYPAALYAMFLCLNLAVAYNPAPAGPCESGSGESLSVLSANLYFQNKKIDDVIKLVKRLQPDVVIFYEMKEESGNRLKELAKDYPFQNVFARDDGFGIGLYSRIKLESSRVFFSEKLGIPHIVSLIKGFTVYGIHPLPPLNSVYTEDRNRLLRSIEPTADLVVIGDMNAVPWSGILRETKKRLRLKDVRAGFRTLLPTWSQPGFYFLGLPLDNCLVSERVRVEEFFIVPLPGSDHRAVFVRLVR